MVAHLSTAPAGASGIHCRGTTDINRNPHFLAEGLEEKSTAHFRSCFRHNLLAAWHQGRYAK